MLNINVKSIKLFQNDTITIAEFIWSNVFVAISNKQAKRNETAKL
jgi:hypothetical protein